MPWGGGQSLPSPPVPNSGLNTGRTSPSHDLLSEASDLIRNTFPLWFFHMAAQSLGELGLLPWLSQ